MKLYVLMQIFQKGKSRRPYKKAFLDYQAAHDCGLKLRKEYKEAFYKTLGLLTSSPEMEFEIYDVELDI